MEAKGIRLGRAIVENTTTKVKIPDNYIAFVRMLKSRGIKSYFVGGCVRDALLGLEYHDYDIVCFCNRQDMDKILNNRYRIEVEFDNIEIICDTENEEYYTLCISESIEKDFNARDLTINSIYYDWENRKIIGYEQSFEDIDMGILNPCNTKEFIKDDLKRIRHLRFAECLPGFMIGYGDTFTSPFEISLESIDSEFRAYRLRNEFLKHKVKTLVEFRLLNRIISKLNEYNIELI